MASGNESEGKCFTFIWEIENARYFRQFRYESPSFVVDEIEGTKWKLWLHPFSDHESLIYLFRDRDSRGAKNVGVEWQVAILASDGTDLSWSRRTKSNIPKNYSMREIILAGRSDLFGKRRLEFLPRGTLTVRCRIWKTVGKMSEDVQWIARTRIGVEKRSFLWKVGNFSSLKSKGKYTYGIKSLETGEKLMCLDLLLTENSDEMYFAVTPKYSHIIFSALELSAVDGSGNAIECLREEFLFDPPGERKHFSLRLSKAMLMEKGDFLSIRCECCFPSGNIAHEIERVVSDSIIFENSETKTLCFGRENEIKRVISDGITFKNSETKNSCLERENVLPRLKNILSDDFKLILNEGILSDIKLKANSKAYPAHKCILGARSPVFKAMFTSDMKEKLNDCVDIEDLSDDTVFRILRYIYSAEVEELEWDSATQLYEASDKYEILSLRDVCSSFLKNNLCPSNACEALSLADLHQDEGFKSFVQDFIVRQGKDIFFSKEFEGLMESNSKLAAETMRLKYK